MKKNRALSRCYLGGYIFWIFGVTLAALMFLKLSIVLMTILIIVAVLILGVLIASHVLYDKKRFSRFHLRNRFTSQRRRRSLCDCGLIHFFSGICSSGYLPSKKQFEITKE